MAHFLEYKSQGQVLPYDFDFTDLLTVADTQLDLVKCKEALLVRDSAGEDKLAYLVQSTSILGKVLTVVLANGLEGEDYWIAAKGYGNVSFLTRQPVFTLELRVRNKILGNL